MSTRVWLLTHKGYGVSDPALLPTQTFRSILVGELVSVFPYHLSILMDECVRGPVIVPIGVIVSVAVDTEAATIESIGSHSAGLVVRDRAGGRNGDG